MDKSVKCAIGEHLVLGELLRRGYSAYLAHGPTQKGWDIIIVKPKKVVRKIQVKAIGWPEKNQRNVTVSEHFQFDYLVVVLLDLDRVRSRFLIATKAEVKSFVSRNRGKRAAKTRTWTISPQFDTSPKHRTVAKLEDAWTKIK